MSDRHSDSDGSNIFWPGYVDATTNLALNLLFLLTIMITAVFMFALEMGRTSMVKADQAKEPPQVVSQTKTTPEDEIVQLKLEIQRLNKLLAKKNLDTRKPGGLEKTVNASLTEPKPVKGVEHAQVRDFEVIVRFKQEAIALNPAETEELRQTLQPIVVRGKSEIYVEVPTGFSESKRMGYYRALAVRNLLINMQVPKDRINVSIVEGAGTADASLVMVR